MRQLTLCQVLVVATVLVIAALLTARASEWWGGMVPCALCLLGRWPYRVVIGFGVLALVVPRRMEPACAVGVVVAMLAGAAIALVHVGVEAQWWPSPMPGCVARFVPGTGVAGLPERPAKPCDDPAFLVPGLPVSMAAMSLAFSLSVAFWTALGVRLARRQEDAA